MTPRSATTTILDEPDLPLMLFYRNNAFVAHDRDRALFTRVRCSATSSRSSSSEAEALFWFVLATLMIPAQVTMIPGYLMLRGSGAAQQLVGAGAARSSMRSACS